MFLPDKDYQSDTLYNHLLLSPVSNKAIGLFSQIYKVAKSFIAPSIFASIRPRVEEVAGMSLNLRTKVDKARFGRILTISELSYRGHALEGFKPLHLLEDSPQQLEMDLEDENLLEDAPTKTKDTSNDIDSPNQKNLSEDIEEVKEERDRANNRATRYHQLLKEYEEFTRLLLVGRIFPAPIVTNGLEEAPLLQVFGGARSLSEVHQAYKELRKAWHPDISPFGESETNARFHWLKQAYTTLVNNWSRFDPQNEQIPADRIEKLKAQELRWDAGSFWYW